MPDVLSEKHLFILARDLAGAGGQGSGWCLGRKRSRRCHGTLNIVSDARPLADLFTLPPREATYVTPSAWGPVVDWQQSNAHRPVEACSRITPTGRFRPPLEEHVNSFD